MLNKVIFFLIVSFSFAFASSKSLEAQYNVSYGIFGQIGIAKAYLHQDKKNYMIDIHLEATGIANILSNNRTERHVSKGYIRNGIMVSNLYQVIRSYGETLISKEYFIEHTTKKVRKKYKKYKSGKLLFEKNTTLDYYAKDDLLTLYFNLAELIKDKHKPNRYEIEAVGAEKQKGRVTLIIPSKNELGKYKEELGDDAAWYATAIIHQKIFSSKEGKLLLGVADDGITNQAVLKDVLFFGDIRGVRVK